jgi:hypothetical protein
MKYGNKSNLIFNIYFKFVFAMSNINVSQYQRPGIYINEIDNSLTQLPVQSQLVNLVVGFSKKGQVNSPVLISSKKQFISIFGDIDRNLEKKGSYFHRTVLNILSKAPVWALNLLDVDDTLDLIDVEDISLTSGDTNSNIKRLPYSSVYDKSQFWNLDTATFLDSNSSASQLLHITNISNKSVSVFMYKSAAAGYDDTLDVYYGSATNVPPYLSPKDQAKDYLVSMVVVQGDWSNYANLSVDTKYSKYFNKSGLIKSAVNSFINDSSVTVLSKYSDLSLIPFFKDLNGNVKFIETVVNQDTSNTGVFVTYNTSLLDDSDYNTGLLDLVGNSIVGSEIETIKYLSYSENLTETLPYQRIDINNAGNAFGNDVYSELSKNFILDSYLNDSTPGSFSITNGVNYSDISIIIEDSSYVVLNGKKVTVNTNSSLAWKTNARVATTTDVVLDGIQTVDGILLNDGDRVLVKNQNNASENGIYIASASTWTRSTDAENGNSLVASTMLVVAGNANQNTKWTCTNTSITLGVTSIVFTQLLIPQNNITVAYSATGRVRKDTIYIDSNGSYGVAIGVEVSDKTLFDNIPLKAIPTSVYPIAVVSVSDTGVDATKITNVAYSVKLASTTGVNISTGNITSIDGVAITTGDRILLKNQSSQIENGVYVATKNYTTTSVKYASTTNVDITTGGNISVDGVTTTAGDRILLKNQADQKENGIYVASLTAWTRSSDSLVGVYVTVTNGSTLSNTIWKNTNTAIVLGTTDITYDESSVKLASISDIDIATGGNISVDGVTTTAGDRILLKNQSDPKENGIYIASLTSWTRSSDSLVGVYVGVKNGNTLLNTIWKNTNTAIVLGTTNVTYVASSNITWTRSSDNLVGVYVSVTHGNTLQNTIWLNTNTAIVLGTTNITYTLSTGLELIKPIADITIGNDNTFDITVGYIGINQAQITFNGTTSTSPDVLYRKTLLKRIFTNFESKMNLGHSVVLDNSSTKRLIKTIIYSTASDSNLSFIFNVDPIYNISSNGADINVFFEDIEQLFGPLGASTNDAIYKVSPDSAFYQAFSVGNINTGDYFYPQYKGGSSVSIRFDNTAGTSTISVPSTVTLSNLSVGSKIKIYGSNNNDSTIFTVLTFGINSTTNYTDIIVNETVVTETCVCDIHNATDKVYIKMFNSDGEFYLSYTEDPTLVGSADLSAYCGNSNAGLSIMRVISLKSDFKETIEIEQILDSNTIVVDATRYSAITIGNYLKASYDASTLQIGEVPRKLTRIVDKRSYSLDVTKSVLKTDSPIDILTIGTDQQTFAYTPIEDYVNTYKAIPLKGFIIRADSMPNGTEERQSAILDLIANNTPIYEGLVNRNKISWRYLVDSFGLGLTANSKQQLADLCSGRSNAFGIINAPSAKSFKTSQTPSFVDSKSKTLRTDYIRQGGNLEANPAFLYSFAQGVSQSYVGYFFPYGSIADNGRTIDVPPASYILNTFMNKHLSTSSSVNPWTPAAGIDNGLVTGIGNLEMDLTNDDITNMNLMGMNPLVYKMNRGFCIETNNTAQTTPKTSLSYISSREALIELEDSMYEMLLGYQWKTNTPAIRAEIKKKADVICESYKQRNAIFAYENVMDETNNLPQYIDAQIGILDSYVEIAKNMAIIVNNVTILPTGAIASGGYKAPNA